MVDTVYCIKCIKYKYNFDEMYKWDKFWSNVTNIFIKIDVVGKNSEIIQYFSVKQWTINCIKKLRTHWSKNKKQELLLLGVVDFHGFGGFRRHSRNGTSHSTAFIYRHGNKSAMEIDDLKTSSTFWASSYTEIPRYLIYMKK